MVHVTIKYFVTHEDDDDQSGTIEVITPTGVITGTWSAEGGMGDGAELCTNTAHEFTDEQAHELLNSSDLCQGDGVYDADVDTDANGWYVLKNVRWHDDQP